MAVAYGPEPTHGASTMDMSSHFTDGVDGDSSIPRTHDAQFPPPNPPFVFPARMDSPASSVPSQPRTTGRRPMSAFEPQRQALGPAAGNADRPRRAGSVALPAFSFNPGASIPPTPGSLLSPPASPYSPKNDLPSPSRPMGHGHRRGGSEFVGGRLREGNSIAVMSTSPTRSENGLSSPTLAPPKRGHRRGMSSANISISDMPNLNPPFDFASLKGSSAPTSPTNFERTMEIPNFQPEPLDLTKAFSSTADQLNTSTNREAPSPTNGDSPPTRAARARVGFSDTLEFIPRPLSMVSSDTSSVATARPGHSLSGSISSVVSAASPSGRESPAPLSRTPTKELAEPRPSTAGAILEGITGAAHPGMSAASPRRRNSIPALLDMPDASNVAPPTPSPSKTPKRWSFFGLDAFATSSPVKARPSSSSSSGSNPRATSAGSSSEHGSESAVDVTEETKAKSKSSKKSKKKKGKSKGWTGSILPRKSKNKNAPEAPERPLTPPASAVAPEDNEALMESPETVSPMTTPTVFVTESTTPPRKKDGLKRRGEDSTVSMIDLDAALGPFNTPLPHNPEWEAAQRAAGNVGKRRLHSAQGLKGFSGPGMHYHRRSESAPDLPPFDAGRAVISRFGSSSTMADVFEEDEEDDESGASEKNRKVIDRFESDEQSDGDTTPPAAPQREFLVEKQEAPQTIKHQSSGLSDKDQSSARSVRVERSRTSLHEKAIAEEPFSFPPRAPNTFHGSIDSTDSGMLPLRQESSSVDASGVQPANIPISPYSMSHASSFPSPRSPVSIDAQRISTAPSSIADETNFQSLLMGEPGPEVRLSIDYDIPSLTSSNSTMTRDSGFAPNLRMPRPALREQRPVSVSSAFGRRRSSLASLSRLISSSHGERSKLSMEVTLDDEAAKNKSKTSRSKRLSKLMQFWKSGKEGSSS
jgi:hypothetical protein